MTTGRSVSAGSLVVDILFRDRTGPGVRAANQNLGALQTRLSGLSARVGQFQESLSRSAAQAGIWGVALTAAAGLTVREFGRTEEAWAKIVGLVGLTQEEVAALQPIIRDIGAQYGLTEADAANAFFTIVSSGKRGQEAMDAFRLAAQGSATQLGEVADITQLLISSLNAFSSQGVTSVQLMDEITATARAGSFEVSQLVPAFIDAASVFASAGVSTSELNTAFAVMSRIQPRLLRNSTALRGIMREFIRPTAQFTAGLEGLGFNVAELVSRIGEPGGFTDVLNDIFEAADGNSQVLGQIFNQEALQGILDFGAAGREVSNAIRNDIVNSVGILDQAFESFDGTVNLTTARTITEFRNAMSELGREVLPIFLSIAEGAVNIIRVFSEELESGNSFLSAMIDLLTTVGTILIGYAVVARIATAAMVAFRIAAWALNFALVTLSLNPWGLAIAGILAGSAAIFFYWENIVKFFVDAWNLIRRIGAAAGIGTAPQLDEPDQTPRTIPSFQRGGLVPGEIGEPLLAVVHGGEFVVPAPQVSQDSLGAPTMTQVINGDINIDIQGAGRQASQIVDELEDRLTEIAEQTIRANQTRIRT